MFYYLAFFYALKWIFTGPISKTWVFTQLWNEIIDFLTRQYTYQKLLIWINHNNINNPPEAEDLPVFDQFPSKKVL